MPRIRTIKSALAEIKGMDSKTALTEYRIRQLVINGEVPSMKCGNKYLVDVDILMKVLEGDANGEKQQEIYT